MSKADRNDNSYSHILKYTGLFGGVQALSIGVALVRNKLVALILGPSGMGLVSLFNSTISFISDSTSFGIGTSAVRNISEAYDEGDDERVAHTVGVVRYWSFISALFGTALCIILSPFLSWVTFSWNGHTLHFMCLAPIVGMMAVTAGETAIIKAVRQLRHLAAISFYYIVAALAISVPIYWAFGMKGIVPSLVLMALAQMVLTITYSYSLFPLRLNGARGYFKEGLGMIRLGLAFVTAGMFGSGASFVIRSYINNVSGTNAVGLYNAGFMMTMTYVSMVFTAMDTDYFPRLSGVSNLKTTFNTTVSRQIEVMLLLVSPILVAFMIGLPIIITVLYSGKFMQALGMTQLVVLAMYLRAVKVPVAYIPLAKGDSLSYMLLEGSFSIYLVAFVIGFYRAYGLYGAGMGILSASTLELFIVYGYARWKYGYSPTASVVKYAAIQFPLGLLSFGVTFINDGWAYWIAGTVLFITSATASIMLLRKKSGGIWESIVNRVKNIIKR